MDLFLETPQQQAERMLRQQRRLIEMQMQGVANQAPVQNVVPAAVPAAVPGCESGLAAIFLASYALTCILNGASPNEVLQHLAALGQRLGDVITTIRAGWES